MEKGAPIGYLSRVTRLSIFAVLAFGLGVMPLAATTIGPSRPPAVTVVRVNPQGRIEVSRDHGTSWEESEGIPTRVLPADEAGDPLPTTAIAVPAASPADPTYRALIAQAPFLKRPDHLLAAPGAPILAAFGGRLVLSTDDGATFAAVDTSAAINASTYITAIAVDPTDHDHWIVGTSYDGLFQTRDAGETWIDLTATRSGWPSYLGTGFFEEFERLWFTAEGDLLTRLGFGQGFLRIELPGIPLDAGAGSTTAGRDSATGAAQDGGSAAARGAGSPDVQRLLPLASGPTSLEALTRGLGYGGGAPAPNEASRNFDPAMVLPYDAGIYLSAANATPDKLPGYFDLIDRYGFTSIVVDFKDDLGQLTYASELETPNAAGAVVPVVEPEELIATARERGIRVIARVVVFKDQKLYAYDNFRYAIWDSSTNRPWGVYRTYTDAETGERRTVQVEHWVDAYSPDVWEYNVSIAEELQELGIDEIQFDYIRFPSDGINETVLTRFQPDGADRVQALEGFLSLARERLSIPISIDVFGFNGWSRMSYLGQDITRLARYVDAISPMFYPSHFARSFMPQFTYLERAFLIYDLGSRRAVELASSHVGTVIRPYVQAFLIHEELQFDRPTYLRYLQEQLEGIEASGVAGYTLWNASGRYYMLP